MGIHITLTPEEERKLAELARGQDPAAHAQDVVTAYLQGADSGGTKTFEVILAPIWEGWRQGGMTDAQVDDLLGQEVRGVRGDRRRSGGTP
jgi:hypothetical protein